MAIIECPECGKQVSNKSKTCIHCGYPIMQAQREEGKLIIKAQTQQWDFTVKQLTYDIFTVEGEKLCTIQPGRVLTIPIDKEIEIYGLPSYGFEYAKNKRKTNVLKIFPNRVTRIQLAFVRIYFGLGIKTVLNEIDIIDSEN